VLVRQAFRGMAKIFIMPYLRVCAYTSRSVCALCASSSYRAAARACLVRRMASSRVVSQSTPSYGSLSSAADEHVQATPWRGGCDVWRCCVNGAFAAVEDVAAAIAAKQASSAVLFAAGTSLRHYHLLPLCHRAGNGDAETRLRAWHTRRV
jgi:hypothetical protein